jgi:hypothetical protein
MSAEYRVWWVPQVPMKAFHYEVPDVASGRLLCDALAKYDLFQFENRVKPDYSNAGGLQELDEDGEWVDFDADCIFCGDDLSDTRLDVGICERCAS